MNNLEEREAMSRDLAGLSVVIWEGPYAEDLLAKFFPVQSCAALKVLP